MALEILAETLLCDCCVIAAANADTSGHDFYCDKSSPEPLSLIEKGWVVPGETYADFSSLPCGGCGERLAGQRHHATVMA